MKNFIIAGIEPQAASIFAAEALNKVQKASFGKQNAAYLKISYNPKSMDLTSNIEEATLLTEDDAYQFRDTLHINNAAMFNTFDVYDINDLKSGAVEVSCESAI